MKILTVETIGVRIYKTIKSAKDKLFIQSEMIHLTNLAYDEYLKSIEHSEVEFINVEYPIGYRADHSILLSKPREYSTDNFIKYITSLKINKLPIDGIFQLVIIIESLLNELVSIILFEYPKKIPNKKMLDVGTIISCESLEIIKQRIIEIIVNEISYKSPKDFATEFENITGINLFEIPAYHHYVELKATRDIYIHNNGISNSIYFSKSGSLARVNPGEVLPVTNQYFLMTYEKCLQLTEVLEKTFNEIWPSNLTSENE